CVHATERSVGVQRDGVLEEPESFLRVTTVVDSIRAEVKELARVAGVHNWAVGVGRSGARKRVAGREAMGEVVLGRAASGVGLPSPARDVLGVLRATACVHGAVRPAGA